MAATMENAEFFRTKDADAPELQGKKAVFLQHLFFLESLVLAALFPIVLGRSGGDTVVAAVWRLSLLLCSYLYAAVCVLSAATRESKVHLFFFLTYTASMAFVVDAVLSRAAGTAIMYLDSVWIAGVFGHALAEHRAPEKKAAGRNPAPSCERKLGVMALVTIAFAACVMSPVCIMSPDGAPAVVVVVLPVLLSLSLTMAIIGALKPRALPGPPGIVVILGAECTIGNVGLCSFISPIVIYMYSLLLVSQVGAAVVLWIGVLGLAVLLGYCVRLHAYSAIHPWFSVRSEPTIVVATPADEVKEEEAAVESSQEEQDDSDGGTNKEQTLISSDST